MENLNNFFCLRKGGVFTSKYRLVIPCAARVKSCPLPPVALARSMKKEPVSAPSVLVSDGSMTRSGNARWQHKVPAISINSANGRAASTELVAQPVVQGLHGIKMQIRAPLGGILVVMQITPARHRGAHAGVATRFYVAHMIADI